MLWALPLALLLTEVVAIWLPQVLGNGRSVAQTAYDGITMGMCLALILGKSVVVLATLRGGAYGGTLQPAVALGALSGILLGTGLHQLPVWEWLPPSAAKADLHSAAVAGSAAFLAVSMNAPLTAFGLVMGFTGQHDTAALPLLASVSAGMGMAHLWPQKKAAPAHESAAHGVVEQVAVRLPARAAVPLAAVAGQGAGAGVPGMLQARDVVREPLPAVVATNMGTVAHEGTSTPPSRLGRQPAMAEAGITEMARIHDAGASVAETVGAGRVRTDVAGEVRAGTVMADVADRAMTGTVVADVADQTMAGTVVADMADRAMAGTVVADVADQAMAGTVVAKVADVDEPVAAPRRKAATRTRTKAATEGTTKRAARLQDRQTCRRESLRRWMPLRTAWRVRAAICRMYHRHRRHAPGEPGARHPARPRYHRPKQGRRARPCVRPRSGCNGKRPSRRRSSGRTRMHWGRQVSGSCARPSNRPSCSGGSRKHGYPSN